VILFYFLTGSKSVSFSRHQYYPPVANKPQAVTSR
jgi:hypothetical protein